MSTLWFSIRLLCRNGPAVCRSQSWKSTKVGFNSSGRASYATPARTRPIAPSKDKKLAPAHSPSSILRQALKLPSVLTQSDDASAGSHRGNGQQAGHVVAYSTAERYDVRALQRRLEAEGVEGVNVLGEAIWCKQDEGELFLFESGTFVTWNVPEPSIASILDLFIRPRQNDSLPKVEVHPYTLPERESLPIIGPNAGGHFGVRNDSITLGPLTHDSRSSISAPGGRQLISPLPPIFPSSTPPRPQSTAVSSFPIEEQGLLLARLAVSAALARACKLSTFETQLDNFLARVSHVPEALRKGNDTPLAKKEVVSRYGELFELRQALSLREENLIDSPDLFWEDSTEERYFNDTLRAFDFTRRIKILNDKLEMAIELQSFLNSSLESRTSHRLEWIIILLILFEVLHAIWREGMPFLPAPSKRIRHVDEPRL